MSSPRAPWFTTSFVLARLRLKAISFPANDLTFQLSLFCKSEAFYFFVLVNYRNDSADLGFRGEFLVKFILGAVTSGDH